nr:MAG TPA: hypothetical protein [Caudoviricetes sp.]
MFKQKYKTLSNCIISALLFKCSKKFYFHKSS